ncbi:MAG: adenylate/guanylate cyclase domain-containing protein [Eubacterium sp.]|nr:adenylate/guanylate cyclase domain-containing protein [Eubacterium sp.]
MSKKLLIFVEALVIGLLVFFLTLTNALSGLDYMVTDKLYQIPRGINSKIKIIGIDEKTLDEYGPIQTWSRSTYAELLNILNQDDKSRPVLIGFDIVFSGNVDEGDSEFIEAVRQSGNVVLVNNLIYSKKFERDENGNLYYPVIDIVEPYGELKDTALIGYANVAQDTDGTVRRIIPSETLNGKSYQLFSKVMYDEYVRIMGLTPSDIPTDKSGRSIINYSGKPGDYEYISMADVLAGKIDARAFTGSVVFVGAYAPGMQDNFRVPNGGSKQMYGVEIHANIFQSYLENRFSVVGNVLLFSIITAVLAALLHIVIRKVRPWIAILILIGATVIEVVTVVSLNNRGLAFSIIYLPLFLLLSFVYSLGLHYLFEKARERKVLNAFRKYVAPEIVQEIAQKGDFEIKLGGENRDIAVLFVDIRGFTTMSEALEPEKVVEILNEYLSLTTKAIFDNKGTLDKFVGDATMAVFNSPFDLPDYEYKAVCAAMDIVKAGEALEKDLLEKYGRTVGFGVGVHCGPAVVGNVGCDFRMDFTAIGDTVNTSARLEANAKKGQVLISDVLYERLKDRIEVNEIGQIPLKGKSNGVMVYEVTGII